MLDIPPWLPPAPSDVVDRFFKTTTLWYHTGLTVLEALAGFVISAVLGVSLLSAGVVHSRFLERGVFPYVIVSNAIPIIAIIPLLSSSASAWPPKIMICSIISFFPIVTNTTRGLKATDRRVIELMSSINARLSEILLKSSFQARCHSFARAGRRSGGGVL